MLEPSRQGTTLAEYQARYSTVEEQELNVAGIAWDIAALITQARETYGPRVVVTVAFPKTALSHCAELKEYLYELGFDVRLTTRTTDSGYFIEVGPARRRFRHTHQRPRRLALA